MNKTDEPKYCEDYCPIYEAIRQYNNNNANTHKIYCTTDMCKNITDAYELNRRKDDIRS